VTRARLSFVLRTRQIQLWKRGEADWDAPEVVRWEEPDLLILDATATRPGGVVSA